MRYVPFIFCLLFSTSLLSQTTGLVNFEVILIGPKNTDRHHPKQVKYYLEYFDFLNEEIDLWAAELNRELRGVRKRNKRRIEKKRPIKVRDYPIWKKNNEILESLDEDKKVVANYIDLWQNFNYEIPDSAVHVFMNLYNENNCYDLISSQLVLAPKEYKIILFEPQNGYFDWKEYIPKISVRCPQEYTANGTTCAKKMELPIANSETPPIFLIENLLTNLPFHLDGFKQITCPNVVIRN